MFLWAYPCIWSRGNLLRYSSGPFKIIRRTLPFLGLEELLCSTPQVFGIWKAYFSLFLQINLLLLSALKYSATNITATHTAITCADYAVNRTPEAFSHSLKSKRRLCFLKWNGKFSPRQPVRNWSLLPPCDRAVLSGRSPAESSLICKELSVLMDDVETGYLIISLVYLRVGLTPQGWR